MLRREVADPALACTRLLQEAGSGPVKALWLRSTIRGWCTLSVNRLDSCSNKPMLVSQVQHSVTESKVEAI